MSYWKKIIAILAIATNVSGCSEQEQYAMKSVAMKPSIHVGQTISIERSAYLNDKPERWDVVGFTSGENPEIWIFRVLGLPNEKVSITDGSVKINSEPISYPEYLEEVEYLPPYKVVGSQNKSKFMVHRVPSDSYFLVGDNSAYANDSRFFGSIHSSQIVGRVSVK
jgi:signal peptidase I